MKSKKPRVCFCFECGRKLSGHHHRKLKNTEDGQVRIFHVICSEQVKKADPELWEEVE